ncbi:hypothetical protein MNBD_GAMMA26-2649, partial [hydrothermal vent metagenome]
GGYFEATLYYHLNTPTIARIEPMKYASYCVDGVPCYGIGTEKGVQTVSDQFISQYPDLKSVLACGVLAQASVAAAAGRVLDFDTVQFNLVIPYSRNGQGAAE